MEALSTPKARLHPVLWVAAVAVTLLSAVGIGAIMGVIPTAGSKPAESVAAVAPAPVAAAVPATQAAPAPQTTQPAPVPAAAEPQPAPQPAPVKRAAPPKPAPKKVAKAEQPAPVETARESAPAPVAETAPPVKTAPAPICHNCGVIDQVREVAQKGEGSGLGAVGGAVVGGLLGHQVGGGRGKDLATVAGAVAGGVAGHQVEKHVRSTKSYEITVRFDDGTSQVFKQDTTPAWRSGDRVKVVNGAITSHE